MMKQMKVLSIFILIFCLLITLVQPADANTKRGNNGKKTTTTEPAPEPTPTPIVTEPTPEPVIVEPKMILGYYVKYWSTDQNSYNSLNLFHSYMNTVSTATFNVSSTGTITGDVPADGVSLANSKNINAYAAIHNVENGSFSPNLARTILSSAELRATTIQNLLTLVKNNGYTGVNMDFENMYATDRDLYSQFIRELVNAFHAQGLKVMVSAPAKTADNPTSAWVGTFDYAALGQVVDKIQLMTYDQHGSWSNVTGPVAGYNWVDKVLAYAVSQIPANKVVMGLPAYGYDWNTTTGSGHKAVSWKSIPNLINSTGAIPQWDEASQSPYFNYVAADGTKHVVWYENAKSIEVKTRLVEKYQLGGVSMWRMGLEDESFWKAVQAGLTVQ